MAASCCGGVESMRERPNTFLRKSHWRPSSPPPAAMSKAPPRALVTFPLFMRAAWALSACFGWFCGRGARTGGGGGGDEGGRGERIAERPAPEGGPLPAQIAGGAARAEGLSIKLRASRLIQGCHSSALPTT